MTWWHHCLPPSVIYCQVQNFNLSSMVLSIWLFNDPNKGSDYHECSVTANVCHWTIYGNLIRWWDYISMFNFELWCAHISLSHFFLSPSRTMHTQHILYLLLWYSSLLAPCQWLLYHSATSPTIAVSSNIGNLVVTGLQGAFKSWSHFYWSNIPIIIQGHLLVIPWTGSLPHHPI